MATTIGSLAVKLTANSEGLTSALSQTVGRVQQFGRQIQSSAISPTVNLAASWYLVKEAVGGIRSAIEPVVANSVALASKAEDASVSFAVLTGSVSEGGKLLKFLEDFAARTPFESSDLIDTSRRLLSMGFTISQVKDSVGFLGDIASGTESSLADLATVFGQIKLAGRLTGQDLMQFTNRGVPLVGELAKQYRLTTGEIREMVSDGLIGFEDVEQALRSMTSAGGLFYEMMDKRSGTLSGQWSTLQDSFNGLLKDIGSGIIEGLDLKGLLGDTTRLIDAVRARTISWADAVDTVYAELSAVARLIARISSDAWKGLADSVLPLSGIMETLIPAMGVGKSLYGDVYKNLRADELTKLDARILARNIAMTTPREGQPNATGTAADRLAEQRQADLGKLGQFGGMTTLQQLSQQMRMLNATKFFDEGIRTQAFGQLGKKLLDAVGTMTTKLPELALAGSDQAYQIIAASQQQPMDIQNRIAYAAESLERMQAEQLEIDRKIQQALERTAIFGGRK